ncbi:MAG: DUF4856 domain-containing protein [Phaeodactylibacter sp.]|uniref:DUF4856 domain-containing protein n=1 Tax=Phaeodactylibacter sp. TaxID=1940289 RepID=UPI0032EC91B7
MQNYKLLGLALALTTLFWSCDTEDENAYTVPDTYNFENVSYDGQLQRLQMLLEMKNYLGSANTPGTVLTADRLKAMYANDTDNANWTLEYDASKQLKSKTFEQEQAVFEAMMEAIADNSTSTVPAAEGQAGVSVSTDGTKQYLLNEKGVELAQLIEKGLMGACFYYQSLTVYFGDDRMNVDNEDVVPGEGTAMEHHWDEAFGYYGVPVDFPLNKDGIAFWGVYSDRRDPILNCNQDMMDAFIKGRAGISNDDLKARDEAISEIRQTWETVTGATAISYLNTAVESFDDMAIRAHALSEAIAFTYAIQFSPEKRMTNAEVTAVLEDIAGSSDFTQMDLYNTTPQRLEAAKLKLADALGLMESKDSF